MQIHVRLGEPFWRIIGLRDLEVSLEPSATLATLIAELCRRYPNLRTELDEAPPVYFLDEDEVEPDALLNDQCQVHLVWPIAGG